MLFRKNKRGCCARIKSSATAPEVFVFLCFQRLGGGKLLVGKAGRAVCHMDDTAAGKAVLFQQMLHDLVVGVASAVLDWSMEHCQSLRADTHADNVYMQRALEKSGFVRCGRIYTEDGSPRWAYYHKAATQKASPAGDVVRAADG